MPAARIVRLRFQRKYVVHLLFHSRRRDIRAIAALRVRCTAGWDDNERDARANAAVVFCLRDLVSTCILPVPTNPPGRAFAHPPPSRRQFNAREDNPGRTIALPGSESRRRRLRNTMRSCHFS